MRSHERHGNESGRRACQSYQSVTTLIKPSCVFRRIYELLRRHRQNFPVSEMTRSPSLPLPPEPSFSAEVLLERRLVSADLAVCRSTVLYSLLPYTNPFIRSRSSVKGLTVRYIYRYAAKVRHPNAFLNKHTAAYIDVHFEHSTLTISVFISHIFQCRWSFNTS